MAGTASSTLNTPTTDSTTPEKQPPPPPPGQRKNGKSWHPPRAAFRPLSNRTTHSHSSYRKRISLAQTAQATKTLEREMKAERAVERDRRVQAIKDRRKAREEKERFERMGEKMHARIVERRRRREGRRRKGNKVL
ncbi:hypothetical protein EPUS_07768 [Endocarpon pusillum Z07020]|uniref:rRNA-processing protein n=1 Tax=Endocarpon pusillum (strain Z07020 / HMAS-L-300199) TaxID=1263415 RepID=U1GH31_ENDPU|nr:uncharacterized protein EPUS_07768 [Endocarpon pusillum Z07020]ERF71096.1 hypothetical protein EPUS_07768 [Endocarpon pusillum Z07020]